MYLKRNLNTPYLAFWALVPYVLLWNMFFIKEDIVVNIHDTYFVIWRVHYAALVLSFCIGTGFVYWILYEFNRVPRTRLFQIHFWLTVIAFVTIAACTILKSDSPYSVLSSTGYLNLMIGASVALVVGNLVFVVTVIFTFFDKPI